MDTKKKRDKISCWKHRGVIYDEFDELYYVYLRTINCSHCGKEFKNSRDRHLDHGHETGLFREIVCCKCNANDSYINYSDGYDIKITKNNGVNKIKTCSLNVIKIIRKFIQKKIKKRFLKVIRSIEKKNKEKFYKKYECGCGGKYKHSSN